MSTKWLTHFCDNEGDQDPSSVKIWSWWKQFTGPLIVLQNMGEKCKIIKFINPLFKTNLEKDAL